MPRVFEHRPYAVTRTVNYGATANINDKWTCIAKEVYQDG